jgi:hypothetical protein
MKKRTTSLASNHHTLRIAPPDLERDSIGPPEPSSPEIVRAVECCFKEQLLKADAIEQGVEVSGTGLRPVRVALKRFGQTALVAGVLRGDENFVESLTICRTGLDNEEDDAAIAAAGELMLEPQDDPAAREHIETLMEEVREQPRPLAVHIHFDANNYADPSVRIVTHSLAESFFDLFGMEKSHHTSDV